MYNCSQITMHEHIYLREGSGKVWDGSDGVIVFSGGGGGGGVSEDWSAKDLTGGVRRPLLNWRVGRGLVYRLANLWGTDIYCK